MARSTEDLLVPPINFGMVQRGVYRSGYPKEQNFRFLKKIGLKSVVCLCGENYPEGHARFWDKEGIRVFHFPLEGNKEPFVEISEEGVRDALRVVLDERNHPLLIHCNKGKHRTGCLVGCLRKTQRWCLAAIFDEYRRYVGSKGRVLDLQFIELSNIAGL